MLKVCFAPTNATFAPHGQGMAGQSWNAAAFLFALQAVEGGPAVLQAPSASAWPCRSELLRHRTDDDLVDVNVGRLFHRVDDRARH